METATVYLMLSQLHYKVMRPFQQKFAWDQQLRCFAIMTGTNLDHTIRTFWWYSPSYEEACKECCTSGSCSSMWTFMAIANVTGIPIQSLYPSINDPADAAQWWLTTLLEPQFFDPAQKPILIMWTNSKPITSQLWTANHFVPLLQPSIHNPQDISVQSTAHSSPGRRNVSTTN